MFTVDNYQKSIFTVDLRFSNVEIPVLILEISIYQNVAIFTVDLPFLP